MFKRHVLIANILSALALAGCAESAQTLAEVPSSQAEGLHATVRVKIDPLHGRRWELGWGAAFVYDDARGRFIRRIPLTGASQSGARGTCRPDMAVSRSGAVIASSNVQPVLWRIDPASLQVRRYEIALDSDQTRDFGFSALAWGVDEKVLYAASAITGTLWRIDLDSATARKIALSEPIQGACGLVASRDAAGSQTLVVTTSAGEGARRISLSSNLARGDVSGPGEGVLSASR